MENVKKNFKDTIEVPVTPRPSATTVVLCFLSALSFLYTSIDLNFYLRFTLKKKKHAVLKQFENKEKNKEILSIPRSRHSRYYYFFGSPSRIDHKYVLRIDVLICIVFAKQGPFDFT